MDEKNIIEATIPVTVPARPRYHYEVLHRMHYEMPKNKQQPPAVFCKIVAEHAYGPERYNAFEDAYRQAIYNNMAGPCYGQEAMDEANSIACKLGHGFDEMRRKMLFAIQNMEAAMATMTAATTEKEMVKAIATFNEAAEVMKINT